MAKSQKPRPAGTLKQAQARLVDAAGGVLKAADYTRVSKSTIFRYTDDAHPDCHMPADVIRALEAAAEQPVVTEFLAVEAGFALSRIAPASVPGLAPGIAACAKEASEVFARAAAALTDGTLSERERGELTAEIDEVLSAFAAVRALVKP